MKNREISKELVQKTVDTLDELESAVLDIKTGVKAGPGADDFLTPAPDYGCPSPCGHD